MTAYNRFPAVNANLDFPPEILDRLAKSLQLRYLVVPMTQAVRDSLSEGDLWVGRTIFNTTDNVLQSWVGPGADPWITWASI